MSWRNVVTQCPLKIPWPKLIAVTWNPRMWLNVQSHSFYKRSHQWGLSPRGKFPVLEIPWGPAMPWSRSPDPQLSFQLCMRNLGLKPMLKCFCNLFFSFPVSLQSGRRNIYTSAKLSRIWPSNLLCHWLRSFPAHPVAMPGVWTDCHHGARRGTIVPWMTASYKSRWWQQLCHPYSMLYLGIIRIISREHWILWLLYNSVNVQWNRIEGSKSCIRETMDKVRPSPGGEGRVTLELDRR